MLIMLFVVNSLYFFWEVIALFICKLPKIKVLKEKIGSGFDTTLSTKEAKLWRISQEEVKATSLMVQVE